MTCTLKIGGKNLMFSKKIDEEKPLNFPTHFIIFSVYFSVESNLSEWC